MGVFTALFVLRAPALASLLLTTTDDTLPSPETARWLVAESDPLMRRLAAAMPKVDFAAAPGQYRPVFQLSRDTTTVTSGFLPTSLLVV
ncbi:hypothetical protein EDD52_109117 [Primorskyibacter sedentarius]|uniref:Uncharacterized protein n=1 Tax=Primorskyibacter sedentarius TaxID=745311 RepID=A0A4R3JA19_9RHOB|nr:hypothetical protein EDD52_109117 [Primorskyibacter sedentarius]